MTTSLDSMLSGADARAPAAAAASVPVGATGKPACVVRRRRIA
jgi:hypothetical protein